MNFQDEALLRLGQALHEKSYRFVTVTPASHARIMRRRKAARTDGSPVAKDLRDVFGWNLPFAGDLLPTFILDLMRTANVLEQVPGGFVSSVRFSSIGDDIFVHSRFPTLERQAVFLGPDTYRFCRTLKACAPEAEYAVDMGCGSGAGGLVIRDRVRSLTLSDVNTLALRYAGINSALAGRGDVALVESDCLGSVRGPCDLVLANPPYVIDAHARTYRHGGGIHGVTLAQRMTYEGLTRLSPGGTLLLYTGTPVVDGRDMFWEGVRDLLKDTAYDTIDYSEIDPDVFGEELDEPAYGRVERLCVVLLLVRRRSTG